MLKRLIPPNFFIAIIALAKISSLAAQEVNLFQYWLELAAADQTYADLASEIGRTEAFREFLGEDSIVFRDGRGPVDALEEYRTANWEADELTWESHYIDVSRDGDLGLTSGPYELVDPTLEDPYLFGHLVSIWKKNNGRWELMADMAAGIPGYLSLNVEPDFEDTRPVLEETAHPAMANVEGNSMQALIDADNLFGLSINFRGGQRALLRYGLESTRVYLPGMAPAIGAEAASSVYGAYLDNELSTINPISLTHMGGYLSTSREMGYTYGIMETSTGEALALGVRQFQTSYLRQWRFNENNEWRIAVEVLNPLN
ncbi:MAG: hypothetical protein CMQ41_02110 [Gammaproteobacteria bacterium]|nr:hypothetical protein [Gammaproteobacteria bacterium]